MYKLKEEFITPLQLTVFLFTMKLPLLLLNPFAEDINLSVSHWLLPLLLRTIIMLMIAAVIVRYKNKRPDRPQISPLFSAAAAIAGVYFSVLYLARLLIFCREFSSDEINEVIIIAAVLIVCSFAAGKGIEAIFRFSAIAFAFIMISAAVIAVFLYPLYNNELLTADKAVHISETVNDLMILLSEAPEIIFLIHFSSYTRKKLQKAVTCWAVFEGLFLMVMLVLICGATGSYTKGMLFPLFRMTDASGSLQRLDPLFIGVMISSFVCFLSAQLYIIKKGAAVLIAERKKSTLLYYAVLSMLFVFPVMLSDNESLMKTLYDKRVMLTVIAVSAAAVPLAVYLCRLLSRKGKKYAVSMGALLLSITLLLTFSSGCKATQLNQRLIVQGIGIDKTPTGCCITLITLDTGSLKEENTITIRNYEGVSIDSAFRNSEYTSGKKLMLSQCLFIIMNRSACKEADNILGYFAKQKEMIKTANIMTSEGTAEDTIKTAVNDYKYHSEDISIISDSSVSDQPVPHFTLFDYISEKDNSSHEILLPVIKTDNKTSSLTCKRGLVLMREKNAVFELNEKQTSAALANSKNRR